VLEGLLEVVGPKGTVVAPTFTFKHEAEPDPVIDPENDPSEMGAISEAIRLFPGALRSSAFRHSLAAIGRRARVITEVDPRLSPFDPRSSFGVMLALNAQVLLLGVPYSNATSFHFCELLCEVPYRHTIAKPAKLRLSQSAPEKFVFTDYQPKPSPDGSYYGKRTMDFNRVGSLLEESQKVTVAAIGNAVARRFSLRDLCDYAVAEMEKDYNIFRTQENETGKTTALKDGEIVLVDLTDGAGRTSQHQWSVMDPLRLAIPPGTRWSVLGRDHDKSPDALNRD
jgi:aminoglycoside N3'-acetyltransferase